MTLPYLNTHIAPVSSNEPIVKLLRDVISKYLRLLRSLGVQLAGIDAGKRRRVLEGRIIDPPDSVQRR